MRSHRFAFFFSGINDAPDSTVGAIHAFWIGIGVLIARIFVIPIHDPDRAVGTNLRADGTKPAVVRAHKIAHKRIVEGGAIGREAVLMYGAVMDVSHQHHALVFARELISLVNLEPRVGGAE